MFLAKPSTIKLYQKVTSTSLRKTLRCYSISKPSVLSSFVSKSINEEIIRRAFTYLTAAAAGMIVIGSDMRVFDKNTVCESYNCNSEINHATELAEYKFATFWPRNIIILLGPPGAGKGTHGPKITKHLGLPQLSTGDILRSAVSNRTETGIRAESIMKSGGLVSDNIVIDIIKDRIQQEDCKFGFILDGFPRTKIQATALDKMLRESEGATVTKVLELNVPDKVLEERVCGRWIHKASGRVYHVKYAPPKNMKFDKDGSTVLKETMIDDITGEYLYQRPDDTAAALVERLKCYHNDTELILDHYKPCGTVEKINANQVPDKVWKDILNAMMRDVQIQQ